LVRIVGGVKGSGRSSLRKEMAKKKGGVGVRPRCIISGGGAGGKPWVWHAFAGGGGKRTDRRGPLKLARAKSRFS